MSTTPAGAQPATRYAPERATLTVPEAARLLGIGRDAAYRAAARGELPTLRVGRRILVPVAALDRMLGIQNVPGDAAGGTSCLKGVAEGLDER